MTSRGSMPGHHRRTSGEAAPISIGSLRLTSVDVAGFRITDARFPPGQVIDRHFHERACLTVVIDGRFVETFSGRACELAVSSMLVKPGGESHDDRFAATGSRQLIIEPGADRVGVPFVARLFDEVRSLRRDNRELALRAVREVHSRDPLAGLALEALALELIVMLGRDGRARADRTPPRFVARARDLLHDGFRTGDTLDDIARSAEVPPARLAREFRRWFGASPAEYRRQLQLDWVATRLVESDDPVAALAAQAGFYDQSHLTHQFRRAFGMTPGAYRRAHGRKRIEA